MKTSRVFRSGLGVTAIVAVLAGLSGCQSPTYGTSKSAAEQLADDLGSAVSIGGGDKKKDVRYNPRPGLVVAGKGPGDLPAPQQSMANRENNPNWTESPEETRQRLRVSSGDSIQFALFSRLAMDCCGAGRSPAPLPATTRPGRGL